MYSPNNPGGMIRHRQWDKQKGRKVEGHTKRDSKQTTRNHKMYTE